MNAIERLRECITDWAGDDETDPAFRDEWEALAAVDALYQAAKKVLDLDYGYEAGHPAWDALAAAVRRIDGDAA